MTVLDNAILRTAYIQFNKDVKRRKPKIKLFQQKYGIQLHVKDRLDQFLEAQWNGKRKGEYQTMRAET